MPTAKARYTGDGCDSWDPKKKEFSAKLESQLRGYYPDQQAEVCETWGHPADAFVSHVLAEAKWAVSELYWQKLDITKQEIRAEQQDLLKLLKSAHDKLRNLSPDFDRLLDIDADPLGCADKINDLIGHVESAGHLIDQLSVRKKSAEKQHYVAVEMTTRVLCVLKDYGISLAATCDVDQARSSAAVQILKSIGDDIGLVLSEVTWRDTITEAKKNAADLK